MVFLGVRGGPKPRPSFVESDGSGGEGGSLLASEEKGNERQVVVLGLKRFHAKPQGAGYARLREEPLRFTRRFWRWRIPVKPVLSIPQQDREGPGALVGLGAAAIPARVAGPGTSQALYRPSQPFY